MSDYTLIAVFTVMEGTFTVTADYCGKYIFVQSLHYTTMKNPIKVSIAIIMTSLVILSGLSLMVLTDEYTNQSKEYTPIGDMDDYIANNSSRSQESIQYNTVYNVTHWSPDIGVARLPVGETNSCVLSETEYADPYKYVQISQETVWSNYDADDSLINKEITLLVKGGGRIFIGDSEKRSDLGELSEYHFKLNGLWHFNTVVYLIEMNNVSRHRWFD